MPIISSTKLAVAISLAHFLFCLSVLCFSFPLLVFSLSLPLVPYWLLLVDYSTQIAHFPKLPTLVRNYLGIWGGGSGRGEMGRVIYASWMFDSCFGSCLVAALGGSLAIRDRQSLRKLIPKFPQINHFEFFSLS